MDSPIDVFAPGLEKLARPIDQLYEDPDNARVHNIKSLDALTASLRRFGQKKPLVILPDGKVKAGNGTLRAATALGWTQVACVVWSGSEDEADAFAIVDNRSAELSRWEDVLLAQAMTRLFDEDAGLAYELGFSAKELQAFRKATEPIALPALEDENERNFVVSIDFANESDEAVFYGWLKYMKEEFPSIPTHGARAVAYVRSL